MYAVQSERVRAQQQGRESGALQARPARAEDAEACASLIFASGVREFGFFLGESDKRCAEFLEFAFTSKHGRFSYRRHHVAVTGDGKVAAVLAMHDGRNTWFDDPHVALMLLMFFGVRRTVAMLLRGLVLESELPAPKSSQTLIAHCATGEQMRSTGVFSTLFTSVLRAGLMHDEPDRQIVLDVLVSNRRAYDLYQRLGFVELPRRAPISRRLPHELESVRMQLMRRA
ncbi:GNAT family N-acetyltransferase [Paraburkholderia sediminicola]|uniref:N-acetyltransferase n=1 Tax=Paraburkholderia sediminicola TaxID=458836 RepID=UPI0038BBAB85